MANVLPRDLTEVPDGEVNPNSALIIDDGSGVFKSTPQQLVASGFPIASQPEAEAGSSNSKAMTPQRVKQAIDALGVSQDILASTNGGTMVGTKRGVSGAPTLLLGSRLDQRPVTLEECGALDGGESTTAVQRAFASFGLPNGELGLTGRGRVVGTPGRLYQLSATVALPSFVDFDAMRCTFEPHPDADPADFLFADGRYWMFTVGADTDGSQMQSGVNSVPWIRNIRFNNRAAGGGPVMEDVGAIYSKGTHGLSHAEAIEMYGLYYRPSPGSGEDTYLDHINMDFIYLRASLGSEWMVKLGYVGDAVSIRNLRTNLVPANRNSLMISQCKGGEIVNMVNGNCLIDRCTAMAMRQFHIETGYIEWRGSGVALENGLIYRDVGSQDSAALGLSVPLRALDYDATRRTKSFSIRNVEVANLTTGVKVPLEYADDDYVDLIVPSDTVWTRENFNRRHEAPAVGAVGFSGAALVRTYGAGVASAGGPTEALRNVAAMAKDATYVSGVMTFGSTTPIPASYTLNGGAPSLSANDVWREASATYYYRIAVLHGPKDRRIARLIAEVSRAAVLDGSAIFVDFSENAVSRPGYAGTTLYIERGTATGDYDRFVEIPLESQLSFYDTGFFVGAGYMWRALDASIIGELNTAASFRKIETRDSINCTLYGTTDLPEHGAWVAGDRFVGTLFEAKYDGAAWQIVSGQTLTSISATPAYVGQRAVVGGVGYMATGTASSADWKQVTA